jgi:hypothetical protein
MERPVLCDIAKIMNAKPRDRVHVLKERDAVHLKMPVPQIYPKCGIALAKQHKANERDRELSLHHVKIAVPVGCGLRPVLGILNDLRAVLERGNEMQVIRSVHILILEPFVKSGLTSLNNFRCHRLVRIRFVMLFDFLRQIGPCRKLHELPILAIADYLATVRSCDEAIVHLAVKL